MALAQDHKVSSCVIGNELTENTIEFLRNIQKFLLVRFKIQRLEDEESTAEEEDDGETKKSSGPIRLECIGVNMTNTARKSL
jgi:predicted metal-binding protein